MLVQFFCLPRVFFGGFILVPGGEIELPQPGKCILIFEDLCTDVLLLLEMDQSVFVGVPAYQQFPPFVEEIIYFI